MKKNDKKNIVIIIIILITIFILLIFYFIDMRRYKILTTIDFSSCKEKCNYNLFVADKVYKLKYEKIENNGYPGYMGEVYLNNNKIMTSEEHGQIRNVKVFKDLLVFEEHVGTFADGDKIKIYNKEGKILKNIYVLDERTGMHVSHYYNGTSSKNYITIGDNDLIIYGTMRYDSGILNINGKSYEVYDPNELVKDKIISNSDIFAASYKISYDDIINGKDLQLYKTFKTFQQYAKEFYDV